MINYEVMKRLLNQEFGKEKDLIGCHIGLFQGDTEVALLDEFPLLNIVGIDPLGAYTKEIEFPDGQKKYLPIMISLENLRSRRDLWERFEFRMSISDLVLPLLKRERRLFDYVYIDGDHHYGQVKRDIENSIAIVYDSGIIAGDDYRDVSYYKTIDTETLGPEVKKAVDELFPEHLHIEEAGTWWAYKKDWKW